MQVTDELLYEYVPRAVEKLLEQYKNCEEVPFKLSDTYKRKLEKLFRQSKHPKLHFRFMTRAGQIVAIIVLCIVLAAATTVSLRAAEVIRIRLKQQVQYDDYIEKHYEASGKGQLKYFTYIPEGYECILFEENNAGYIAKYESENEEMILIMVTQINDGTTVVEDTEVDFVCEKMIAQYECKIRNKNAQTTNYVWIFDGYRYDMDAMNVPESIAEEMICFIQ